MSNIYDTHLCIYTHTYVQALVVYHQADVGEYLREEASGTPFFPSIL